MGILVHKMARGNIHPNKKPTDAFYYEFQSLQIEAHELYSKDHWSYIHVDALIKNSSLPQMKLLRSLSGVPEKITPNELFALQFNYPKAVEFYRKQTTTWLKKLQTLIFNV